MDRCDEEISYKLRSLAENLSEEIPIDCVLYKWYVCILSNLRDYIKHTWLKLSRVTFSLNLHWNINDLILKSRLSKYADLVRLGFTMTASLLPNDIVNDKAFIETINAVWQSVESAVCRTGI